MTLLRDNPSINSGQVVERNPLTLGIDRPRVAAIDVSRGLAMVLMPLDHTREFFTNWVGSPLDPQHTTVMLYLTRWITHLCAPIFVCLAGTSIFLQRERKTRVQLTKLLILRGLWLIFAEVTLVHLAFNFHWQWNVQLLEVIWAVGASMVVMAALIHLSVYWIMAIGTILIVGHNAFDGVAVGYFGTIGWLWNLLHVPGLVGGASMKPPIVIVAYPLIPWIGVMALGYAFGNIIKHGEKRVPFELRVGTAMLAAFVLLRSINLYGDPMPWTSQVSWDRTLMSFLNLQKYPPSFLFLLATLGIAALLMAAIEVAELRGVLKRLRDVLKVYGRVPFFYFLLHITVIHLLALSLSIARGENWRWWLAEFPQGGVLAGHPPGYGYGLTAIWSIWIFVVIVCYPACKWYAGVKTRSRSPLLTYL